MQRVREIVEAHDADIISPLTANERKQLRKLLEKMAGGHRLSSVAHAGQPGHRPPEPSGTGSP